jgi:hypothetical protein
MKRGLSVILLFAFAASASAQVSKSGTGVMPTSASSDAAPKPVNPNLAPSQIFSRARPSVVVIIASDQNDQREALGSGFIVDHGKIITNHHVVEGMNQAYVVFFSSRGRQRATGPDCTCSRHREPLCRQVWIETEGHDNSLNCYRRGMRRDVGPLGAAQTRL